MDRTERGEKFKGVLNGCMGVWVHGLGRITYVYFVYLGEEKVIG